MIQMEEIPEASTDTVPLSGLIPSRMMEEVPSELIEAEREREKKKKMIRMASDGQRSSCRTHQRGRIH